MCYNSFKPMKRRSRHSTESQRVVDGGSTTIQDFSNGPLRANGNAKAKYVRRNPSVKKAGV